MDTYYKDPELKGIYVKRCKCGARPYYDRIDPCMPSYGCWISCNCGVTGISGDSKEEGIDNWNEGKFFYDHNMVGFRLVFPKKWSK